MPSQVGSNNSSSSDLHVGMASLLATHLGAKQAIIQLSKKLIKRGFCCFIKSNLLVFTWISWDRLIFQICVAGWQENGQNLEWKELSQTCVRKEGVVLRGFLQGSFQIGEAGWLLAWYFFPPESFVQISGANLQQDLAACSQLVCWSSWYSSVPKPVIHQSSEFSVFLQPCLQWATMRNHKIIYWGKQRAPYCWFRTVLIRVSNLWISRYF